MRKLIRSASVEGELFNKTFYEEKVTKRKKFTDFLCGMIEYFSLLTSIFYNLFWLYYFKSHIEVVHSNANIQAHCSNILVWTDYIFTWLIICIVKAFIFLVCTKICCGNENDCAVFCFFLKVLTSFIPAVIFVLKIPEDISNYMVNKRNTIELNSRINCDEIVKAVTLFERSESWFIIAILMIFCIVPFGAMMMGLKEIWKSRGYKKRKI